MVRDDDASRAQPDDHDGVGLTGGGEGAGGGEHDPARKRDRGRVDERGQEHDRVGVLDQPRRELLNDPGHGPI